MGIFLGAAIVVVGVIIIWFNIPYSRTNEEFKRAAKALTQTQAMHIENDQGYFSEQDIEALPVPVQRYFQYCGFLGTPKMPYMKAGFKAVDFSLGRGKRTIKIDYTQYNAVHKPERVAFINSSLFGIPFEGKDSYIEGKGSMKGVLAKGITLFDQRGEEMDQASLVTYLSESLLVPSVALQNFIVWEAIDDLHSKATISYYGISASGIFTFNEKGEMTSFSTEDREAISMDGSKEKVKWTAVLSDYRNNKDGIKQPARLQAIWNYEEGDLLYFNGLHATIEYGFKAD